MKIKVNKYCILLFLLIFFELDCFYLINRYAVYIVGISYYDMFCVAKLLIIFCTICKYSDTFRLKKTILNIFPIGALVITCTSAVAANIITGQGIIEGIIAQRDWLSWMLMYYPISIWLRKGKLDGKKILTTLCVAAIVYLSLCMVQYLIAGKVIFLHTDANERYGSVRLRFSSLLPLILSGFMLDNIVLDLNRKSKKYSFVILIATFVFITVVTKGRMRTLAFCAGIVICLLLRRTSITKKFISILCVILLVVFLASTQIGKDTLDIFFGSGTGTGADTLSIRTVERLYYFKHLTQSPFSFLFGCGYPASTYYIAQYMSTPTIGTWTYYTTDVGILGSMYYYGILGCSWFVIIYLYTLKKGIIIYKHTGKTGFAQGIIVDLIGCTTLVPLIFNSSILMPLLVAWVESEERAILKKQSEKIEENK